MIAIAKHSLHEIVRRRFVLAALIGTVAIALLSGWGFAHLASAHRHGGGSISPMQIKAVSAILVALMAWLFSFILAFAAALVASPALSAEIDSGILLPVLARPVSRTAVVAGKAVACAIVTCAYAAFAGALEFAVVATVTGYVPPHPVAALTALAALSLVMVAATLALSSRLPAMTASIVAVACFGVAWFAGIVASFYPVSHDAALARVGVISQLIFPSDAFWRTAAYQLQPAAFTAQAQSAGVWQGPFIVTGPPPPAMLAWATLWILAVLVLSAYSFGRRDA